MKIKNPLILTICFVFILLCSTLSLASDKGRVVDINGKPIANATIVEENWNEKGLNYHKIITDSSGYFDYISKGSNKPISCNYLVFADGYSFWQGSPNYPRKEKEFAITLYPEQKLCGKITDENSKPLSGVNVKVIRSLAYDETGHILQLNWHADYFCLSDTTTRRDGSFVLNNLPSPESLKYGDTTISVQAQGRAIITKIIKQEKLGEELTIPLPRECVLAGTLYLPDKSGTAPEGTPLIIYPADGDWNSSREFSVVKDGKFLISQLAPGKYRLLYGPNFWYGIRGYENSAEVVVTPQADWVFPAMQITINPDEAKTVEVVSSKGVIVKGRVLNNDDDLPVRNVIVSAVHPGRPQGTTATTTVTDTNGDFSMRIAAGDITLRVDDVFRDFKNSYSLQPNEKPTLSFSVPEGGEKTDAVLRVIAQDPPVSDGESDEPTTQSIEYSLNSKPVTRNLTLQTGIYDMKWDQEVPLYHGLLWSSLIDPAEVRKLITKLPVLKSEKPLFLAYEYDGQDTKGSLLAVMDESHGTGSGYDRVYFDSNRNTDLSDETPARIPRVGHYHYARSEWMPVKFHQGKPGNRQEYTTNVRLEYYKTTDRDDFHRLIMLQRKGAWRGKIGSSNGILDCVLPITYDFNGVYGKHTTRVDTYNSGNGDDLYIDTNNYGSAQVLQSDPHQVRLNTPAKVADKYYDINTSETGDKVSIRPFIGKLGVLNITSSGISGFNARPTKVVLYNDHGEYAFDMSSNSVTLPAGTYKMAYCRFDLGKKTGEKTRLICIVHDKLIIASNKKTNLDISGIITLEIAPHANIVLLDSYTKNSIQVRAKIGERVTVAGIGDRIMYGLHGSYLSSYTMDNNLYPQVNLLDDKGKSLASVTSNYTFHVWTDNLFDANLPTLKTGKCTLLFTIDTKTPIGKLITKKQALIRDPEYRNTVVTEYQKVANSGNQHDIEKAKSELLKKLFVGSVIPGKPYDILYRRYGEYPTKDKLSGIIKWYPKNDYLQIMVDVIDDFFSTDAYEGKYYRASSVELYIDPSGTSSNQIVVVPRGKNGVAAVTTTQKSIDISKVKANYKRTAKGYAIDVRIPWGILSGYSRGWKLMPVGAFINSRTGGDRTQLNFAESPYPYSNAALVPEQKSSPQLR